MSNKELTNHLQIHPFNPSPSPSFHPFNPSPELSLSSPHNSSPLLLRTNRCILYLLPRGPRAPGFRPNWNCSWKLNPSSNWLDTSPSPGLVIDSTIVSASTICCNTSLRLDSHNIPPMNISNSIANDLCNEKTRSSSQTIYKLFSLCHCHCLDDNIRSLMSWGRTWTKKKISGR